MSARDVRYVLIGVSGINLHAHGAGVVFTTQDRDVLLPPDAENLLRAWQACESCGLELFGAGHPLEQPRDLALAKRAEARGASTHASDGAELRIDFTFDMAAFEFEVVWQERTVFQLEVVDVPVARLKHIVISKARLGRDKDRLFLATHEAALQELLSR